jgi:hypothetical protein
VEGREDPQKYKTLTESVTSQQSCQDNEIDLVRPGDIRETKNSFTARLFPVWIASLQIESRHN